jgi:hypothetical protein
VPTMPNSRAWFSSLGFLSVCTLILIHLIEKRS